MRRVVAPKGADRAGREAWRRGCSSALSLALLAVSLLLSRSLDGVAAATPTPADVPQVQAYSDAFDGPTATAVAAALPQAVPANVTSVVVGAGEGPRQRRPAREQWDLMGPALLMGGTLALLVLAAVGHLAGKALLASMLSAALSAVQLSRPPSRRRPG